MHIADDERKQDKRRGEKKRAMTTTTTRKDKYNRNHNHNRTRHDKKGNFIQGKTRRQNKAARQDKTR
jgi:hypothetical protein